MRGLLLVAVGILCLAGCTPEQSVSPPISQEDPTPSAIDVVEIDPVDSVSSDSDEVSVGTESLGEPDPNPTEVSEAAAADDVEWAVLFSTGSELFEFRSSEGLVKVDLSPLRRSTETFRDGYYAKAEGGWQAGVDLLSGAFSNPDITSIRVDGVAGVEVGRGLLVVGAASDVFVTQTDHNDPFNADRNPVVVEVQDVLGGARLAGYELPLGSSVLAASGSELLVRGGEWPDGAVLDLLSGELLGLPEVATGELCGFPSFVGGTNGAVWNFDGCSESTVFGSSYLETRSLPFPSASEPMEYRGPVFWLSPTTYDFDGRWYQPFEAADGSRQVHVASDRGWVPFGCERLLYFAETGRQVAVEVWDTDAGFELLILDAEGELLHWELSDVEILVHAQTPVERGNGAEANGPSKCPEGSGTAASP